MIDNAIDLMKHRDETDFGKPEEDAIIVEGRKQLAVLGATILELRVIQARARGSTIAKRGYIKTAREKYDVLSAVDPEGHMHPTIHATLQCLKPK